MCAVFKIWEYEIIINFMQLHFKFVDVNGDVAIKKVGKIGWSALK